eukprot:349613-Chlamydomonas_euryale.AAC.2
MAGGAAAEAAPTPACNHGRWGGGWAPAAAPVPARMAERRAQMTSHVKRREYGSMPEVGSCASVCVVGEGADCNVSSDVQSEGGCKWEVNAKGGLLSGAWAAPVCVGGALCREVRYKCRTMLEAGSRVCVTGGGLCCEASCACGAMLETGSCQEQQANGLSGWVAGGV